MTAREAAPGQVAYEAYWLALDKSKGPIAWEKIKPETAAWWEAAAQAAINEHELAAPCEAVTAAAAAQPAPGDTRAQHAGSPDLQDEWKTELIAKVRLLRGTVALRDAEIRQIQERVAYLRAILLEGDEDDVTVRLRAIRQIEAFGLPADAPAEAQPAPGARPRFNWPQYAAAIEALREIADEPYPGFGPQRASEALEAIEDNPDAEQPAPGAAPDPPFPAAELREVIGEVLEGK